MSRSGVGMDLGRSGVLTFLGLAILAVVITFIFNAVRPPTVEEVEEDIWRDWVRATVDNQGENIAGLVDLGRSEACQRLLTEFGQTVANHGNDFVLRTDINRIFVLDRNGDVFASWTPTLSRNLGGEPWTLLDMPLSLEGKGDVGRLRVEYKFNESTLESLPNIRRLGQLHDRARWLVGILAGVLLVAAFANLQRIKERAGRLQSQQVTLDLARQMCHELRNGLWAFSLEGRNLRQLFDLVEGYFEQEPKVMKQAAQKLGMSAKDVEQLRRSIQRRLAEEHLEPQTDVLAANAMARDAQQQIESFSRYIHLTVEQLDRNLLGAASSWEPEYLRVSDAWREACELLQLRFRSSGVERIETFEDPRDWVFLDRRALVHVFVNLAKNAIEAMRELSGERRMSFTLRESGTMIEAVLHNPGPPIPSHLVPHVFERGVSTKAGAGRGLGLALVRDSIARMQGSIALASDETGTRIRLLLPRKVPSPNAMEAETDSMHGSPTA